MCDMCVPCIQPTHRCINAFIGNLVSMGTQDMAVEQVLIGPDCH